MSPPSSYNVNMIATPPPAEPQFVSVSAIFFSPEDGEFNGVVTRVSFELTRLLCCRAPKNRHCQLSALSQSVAGNVPYPYARLVLRRKSNTVFGSY